MADEGFHPGEPVQRLCGAALPANTAATMGRSRHRPA